MLLEPSWVQVGPAIVWLLWLILKWEMGDGTWEVGDVRWEMGVGHGRLEMAMGDWGRTCFFLWQWFVCQTWRVLSAPLSCKQEDKNNVALLAVAGSQDQQSLPPWFWMKNRKGNVAFRFFVGNVLLARLGLLTPCFGWKNAAVRTRSGRDSNLQFRSKKTCEIHEQICT